jgi:hypothetical protein
MTLPIDGGAHDCSGSGRLTKEKARRRLSKFFSTPPQAGPRDALLQFKAERLQDVLRWAILDSNQGPPPYQSGALTS